MAQLLCMGGSIVYGVGGTQGGWADMIKRQLHEQMYAQGLPQKVHETYIFGKPDATIQFVTDTYTQCIANYRREGQKTIVVLSVGMNDAKAVEQPDNYLNTPEQYKQAMLDLLRNLSTVADAVLCVGFSPVDETKTLPKLNPLTGKKSFFSNQRIQTFSSAFAEAAATAGSKIHFVDVASTLPGDWTTECLGPDGIHPNDAGYRHIFEIVMPEITRLISI
jgi:lysophospholipase L1-like esterase